jgi:hypothetical protein
MRDSESSDAAADATADVSTTVPAEPTGTPIVVFSSRNDHLATGAFAFVAGLQAQNTRGGVNGHPIQADYCDNHGATQ